MELGLAMASGGCACVCVCLLRTMGAPCADGNARERERVAQRQRICFQLSSSAAAAPKERQSSLKELKIAATRAFALLFGSVRAGGGRSAGCSRFPPCLVATAVKVWRGSAPCASRLGLPIRFLCFFRGIYRAQNSGARPSDADYLTCSTATRSTFTVSMLACLDESFVGRTTGWQIGIGRVGHAAREAPGGRACEEAWLG